MKKIITLSAILFVSLSYGQNLILGGEIKEIVKISKTNVEVSVEIPKNYKIEIDGHIINEVITFEADLNGVKIKDKDGVEYENRKCSHEKCDLIHLVKKFSGYILSNRGNYLFNNTK